MCNTNTTRWREGRDQLWHILKYIRYIFYTVAVKSGVNAEATTLLQVRQSCVVYVPHNTTQNNTPQPNTTQHNTPQPNTTQHNTTRHTDPPAHTHIRTITFDSQHIPLPPLRSAFWGRPTMPHALAHTCTTAFCHANPPPSRHHLAFSSASLQTDEEAYRARVRQCMSDLDMAHEPRTPNG